MADDDAEKTQEPTERRRRDAREQGNIPRSADLAAAVLLLVGVWMLRNYGPALAEQLVTLLVDALGAPRWRVADTGDLNARLAGIAWNIIPALAPILLALFAAAAGASLAQTGFVFLPEKLQPDFSRLNPLNGFSRILSMQSVVQTLFGLGKMLLIGAVGWWALADRWDELLLLAQMSIPQIASWIVTVTLDTAQQVGIALLLLSLADYLYQWRRIENELMMSREEVREEMRQYEGDPQVAARRKQVHRQLARNRTRSEVPKADFVVTNPTELAVAIQYDPKAMAAPIVVAKGAGLAAKQIRRIALEHGIPIIEKKPLAQALYKEVEIGRPVPPQAYAAVAEILAYVYQLQGKSAPDLKAG